jgi:tetratricopeptide (TPR) repeat protein
MKASLFVLIALTGLDAYHANGQEIPLKIPASSTGQRIEQDFGLGMISIKYYRPNTKGRKIFNGMEPYGRVWRTGANNATIIKLTDTIMMENHTIAPGSYSLFTIPDASEWTVILNKNAEQWGAYDYDEKQDLLRFKVKPAKLDRKIETLTIQFADMVPETGLLQILWENTAVNIHLKADVDDRIMANIEEAIKGEKKPYYMSAIWCYYHNRNLDQALAWMKEADKAQPQAFNIKYWLGRLQLKTGDKKAAIASATEGLKLASAQKDAEYIRMNKEVLHDAGVN